MSPSYLKHYGVLGMKWGIRRYQNYDGSLKKAGKEKLSEEQKKRETLKRAGMITAALGAGILVGGAAYALYNGSAGDIDFVVKAGMSVQRIAWSNKAELGDVFYAAKSKTDKLIYAGKLGTERFEQSISNPGLNLGGVSKLDITAKKDIKVCGNKNAEKIWNSIPDDKKGVLAGETYKSFNRGLCDDNIKTSDAAKAFFQELADNGYGGVVDHNDTQGYGYSSYGVRTAAIFFDQKKNVSVKETSMGFDEAMELSEKVDRIVNSKIAAEMFFDLSKPAAVQMTAAGSAAAITAEVLDRLDKKKKAGDEQ